MSTYLPAVIWILSSLVCIYVAKRRHVRPTPVRAMLVALTGPFAIPWVMVAKPE
jgi:hypothetical protein